MKRKIVAYGLCLSLSVLALTGCNTNAQEQNTNTAVETQQQEPQKETEAQQESIKGEIVALSDTEITIKAEEEEITYALAENVTMQADFGKNTMSGERMENDRPTPPDTEASEKEQTDRPTPPDNEDSKKEQTDRPTPPDNEDSKKEQTDRPERAEMPEANTEAPDKMPTMTLQDLKVGMQVELLINAEGTVSQINVSMEYMMSGAGMGAMQTPDSYEAVNAYTEDSVVSGETILSEKTDENAVHVLEGAQVSFDAMQIKRESEESKGGDTASFYGVGAAMLVTDGVMKVSDSTIQTNASGAAGVFAYDKGTAYVENTEIKTQKDTSGGIHVAGGGKLYASNLTVETKGESAAAVRSDRGGGKMIVDGGTYTSHGVGSPAVYSTADITIKDAELAATGAEAVCIEGMNTLRLYNCVLSGNMPDNEQNDCTWNVILYQSMSGDSAYGNSTFEMCGGTLKASNGGMFYTTNTESTFVLSDVKIENAENSDFLLRCTGNNNKRGWGEVGKNGADCSFTAIKQNLEGDIVWDSISQLDVFLTENSQWQGAILQDEAFAGNGGNGYSSITIDSGSTWVVTGDSTVTNLYQEGTITDTDGKSVSIVGTDGTVYAKGDSAYTITVKTYDNKADLTAASSVGQWSDYSTL